MKVWQRVRKVGQRRARRRAGWDRLPILLVVSRDTYWELGDLPPAPQRAKVMFPFPIGSTGLNPNWVR